jgi:HlyD family secretion protein
MMSKKTLYIVLGLGIGLLILAAIASKMGVFGGEKATKVAVEEVKPRNLVESVGASGKLYPVVEVKVSPDISGEVVELYVEEGQTVQKGQLLARIDASLYTSNVVRANAQVNQSRAGVANAKAQLAQLGTQLDQAKSNFVRNQKLYTEKVISAVEFEQAQTAYKSAQASIEAARSTIQSSQYNVESSVAGLTEANQNIRRANLYAPVSGIVSKLNVKQGERVVGTAQMAGTEMLRIADMSVMKVEVEIGENDIQKIHIGDTANIEIDAYPKRKFKGMVTKTAQSNTASAMQAASSDQVSNYTVSIEMDANSYIDLIAPGSRFPFRPGMSASVDILTTHIYDALCVPINAVTTRDLDTSNAKNKSSNANIETELKEYVFIVTKENKTELKEVTTSIQDNEYISISKGLAAGEKVIFAPYSQVANKLKNKQVVQIVKKEELFEIEEEK